MIDSIENKTDSAFITLSGTITTKEIEDVNTRLFQHPDFESCKYQIWLFKDVIDFITSADEIMRIAERDRKESTRNPELKVAIVSDSQLVYGLGRMYEAFYDGGPWETMVFRDLDEANKWVGS